MTIMKKFMCALAVALIGGVSLAAEGDTFDFSVVNTNMTSLKEALTTWSTAFTPILLGVVGVFIAYWLIKFAIRLIKSMSSTSK